MSQAGESGHEHRHLPPEIQIDIIEDNSTGHHIEDEELSAISPSNMHRVDSVVSIDSLGSADFKAQLMRSPSTDALMNKISKSQSMQFAILNREEEAGHSSIEVTGKSTVILPSQRTLIKEHLLRKEFRKNKLEWRELKQKSREWLEKADIYTEPDELFVEGVPTIDEVNIDSPPPHKAHTYPHNEAAAAEQQPNKGIFFNTIQKIRTALQKQNTPRLPRTAPVPYRKMTSEDQREVRLLVIDFGYAMSIYGIPSHRLETNLSAVSNYYGVTGNFFCTPTGIWYNFGSIMDDDLTVESSQPNYAFFVRVNAGAINLSKFAELDRLALHISSGRVTDIQSARKMIRRIVTAEELFRNPTFTIFIYAAFASMFPVLMNGTWGETVAGFMGGLMVGLIALGKEKSQLLDRIGNGLSSLCSAFAAILFRLLLSRNQVYIDTLMVSLAGVIMLLPGLSLMIAIEELSQGHLMSGIMRVAAVLVRVVELGFGMLVADRIDQFLEKELYHSYHKGFVRTALPVWLQAIILPVLIVIIIIMFKAPKYISAYIFISIGCYVAFFGGIYLNKWLGTEIGGVATSFLVGFTANLYTLISKRPNNVVTICAIVLLVPGYITAASVGGILSNNANETITLLLKAVIAAASLVTGLIVAEVLWPKKRARLAY